MRKFITAALTQAALVVGTTLASIAPAHADLISTAWDPIFGPPLTNLGWKGTMTFESTTGDIRSLNVSFYDANDASQTVIALKAPLFNTAALTGVLATVVDRTADNKVKTYRTGQTGFQKAEAVDPAINVTKGWEFSIKFDIFSGITVARLFARQPDNDKANVFESNEMAIAYCDPDVANNDACAVGRSAGVILRVPEPGSLALVVAALAGLGLAGRRRWAQPRAAALA